MTPQDDPRPRPSVSEASFTADFSEETASHQPRVEAPQREMVRPYLFDQKKKFTEQLVDTARALRHSGTQMPNDSTAGLIRISADTLDRVGEYLRDRSIDDIVDDAQAFARRRPWWIVGGAFVAGLAAARFMKSSGRSNARGSKVESTVAGAATGEPPTPGI